MDPISPSRLIAWIQYLGLAVCKLNVWQMFRVCDIYQVISRAENYNMHLLYLGTDAGECYFNEQESS